MARETALRPDLNDRRDVTTTNLPGDRPDRRRAQLLEVEISVGAGSSTTSWTSTRARSSWERAARGAKNRRFPRFQAYRGGWRPVFPGRTPGETST